MLQVSHKLHDLYDKIEKKDGEAKANDLFIRKSTHFNANETVYGAFNAGISFEDCNGFYFCTRDMLCVVATDLPEIKIYNKILTSWCIETGRRFGKKKKKGKK